MDNNLLNLIVSKLYNYSKIVKYYHWNYKDSNFFPIHPQLDDIYDLMLDHADNMAELGRTQNLSINPLIDTDNTVFENANFINTITAITALNQDIINDLKSLRATVNATETGLQSEIDGIIYDFQWNNWKWNSMKD